MDAEAIRQRYVEQGMGVEISVLAEIAAQLADLNAFIRELKEEEDEKDAH